MTATELILDEPLVRALGWALLHFVWQGALVGLLAAAALRLLRHSAADVRYVVAVIALALMATMPVVTGVQAWRASTSRPVIAGLSAEEPSEFTGAASTRTTAVHASAASAAAGEPVRGGPVAPQPIERLLPLVVVGWMIGVAALALRLVGGWIWIQRTKRRGAVAADAMLQAMLRRLTKRLHISRRVSLIQSAAVDVPTVIGWLKPTVLLPVSAMAGLSPLQVEAILAHELAHVRRHDYLVNLLQALLETLLFYHPAVWWLSRRIRVERENCCDDLAVNLCGDPVVYARALADLEELRGAGPQLAMAATGGALLDRIRRLLAGPTPHAGRGPAWLAAVVAVVLMVGLAGGAIGRQPPVGQTGGTVASTDIDALRIVVARTLHAVENLFAEPRRSQDPPPPPPVPPAPPAPPPVPVENDLPVGVPAAPAPPAVPAPPVPPAPGTSVEIDGGSQESGTFTWSNNGEKLEVKYRGTFELNDTDTDIVNVSPGGHVTFSDGRWMRGARVEFSADASGRITRRFFIGSGERPFEPEGREFLAKILPRFVRSSGFAAKARVARFLRNGGVDAVLGEISLIEGDYGRKRYFSELLNATAPDAAAARKIAEQAGRQISSDYELASVLITGADRLLLDASSQAAYLKATATIDSDYELRRVLTAVLKSRAADPSTVAGVLEAAGGLSSDYESASLLLDIVRAHPVEGQLRAPFFRRLGSVNSSYEKGRVLQALLKRGELAADTLLDVLAEAARLPGHYETSQVLQLAARTQSITGAARDAYIRAAERLGDYEEDRAMAALVRHERR